jgi:hypothetical protein
MSFVRSGFARAAFATPPRSRGRYPLSPLGLVLDLACLFAADEALVAMRDLEGESSGA